jgi:ammonium transporter, Amt family
MILWCSKQKETRLKIDTGSTAWMLASTALVLLMTPGLAFFYGGMTRVKCVLNMVMMSWVAIITVTIAWVLYGDSLLLRGRA